MNSNLIRAALALTLTLAAAPALEAQQRPYSEGVVVEITEIRTMPGQYENYLGYIFGDYAKLMEAQKAEGIILDWGVYAAQPRSPEEGDLLLTVAYANMAALDGLSERTEPIVQRVMSRDRTQAAAASAQRESMRRIVGTSTIRRLAPKP
ncbi:MAG TPA: hypothetical protein VK939_06935 [Longimicrobiales bacterium]|nr:hypothetical protein [Longimicrobiales bacterium]